MRPTALGLAWLLALSVAGGPAVTAAPVRAGAQETPATPESGVAAGARQIEEGDFEGAVKTLETAIAGLRGDPRRAHLLVQADIQLAVAHVALDQAPQAVEAFTEALALNPKLQLGADRYSPKVLRAFETARQQAAGRAAAPGGARTSHGKAWLIGGGVAVAAGTAVILTSGGGSASPAFSGARFGTPVLTCPNGSDNLHLPFTILVEASNSSGDVVPITSVSAVVEIVNATVTSEIGFSSAQSTTVVPSSLPAKQSVTLHLDSFLICGNGAGDSPRFNQWRGRVSLTTASGVVMLDVADQMSVNIP